MLFIKAQLIQEVIFVLLSGSMVYLRQRSFVNLFSEIVFETTELFISFCVICCWGYFGGVLECGFFLDVLIGTWGFFYHYYYLSVSYLCRAWGFFWRAEFWALLGGFWGIVGGFFGWVFFLAVCFFGGFIK